METLNYGGAPASLSYLNLEQGIRMDYPASWTVNEQSSPCNFVVVFSSPEEDASDPFRENLTLTVQALFPAITQEIFVESWQAMGRRANVEVLETGNATLANRNSYRIVFNTPLQTPVLMAGKVMMFLFVIAAKGYMAAYTGRQGHFEMFLPAVEQMLATLQIH